MVSFACHATSSSYPPSTGTRDIEGLTSLTIANLAATFKIYFSEQAHSTAAPPPLLFLVVKGPVMEGNLELPEVVANLRLDSVSVVKVNLSFTS